MGASFQIKDLTSSKAAPAIPPPKRVERTTITSSGASTEPASRVSLSGTQSASQRSSDRIRNLSDATSFIDIGKDAVENVDAILRKQKSLAEAIESEVDPTKKAKLATEAADLTSEISRIESAATFNNQAVINSGAKRFSFDFNPHDLNSSSTVSIEVANIGIDAVSLGTSGLTSSVFQNQASAAVDTVEAAISKTAQAKAQLDSAGKDIQAVASSLGIGGTATAKVEAEKPLPSVEDAQKLAQQVVNNLQNAPAGSDSIALKELDVRDVKQITSLLNGGDEKDAKDTNALTPATKSGTSLTDKEDED